ncbi:hypothetical protein AB1399_02710, partial [Hydrogenibacillus schlegelii]|uniref:hypothetical protein n=1 Tax=Hydrogenibacillus schlegelii TaxID=1484 RepID=UPI0034A0853C
VRKEAWYRSALAVLADAGVFFDLRADFEAPIPYGELVVVLARRLPPCTSSIRTRRSPPNRRRPRPPLRRKAYARGKPIIPERAVEVLGRYFGEGGPFVDPAGR